MTASIADLAAAVRAQLAQDEVIAREACGGTVVGTRGDWRQAPGGDEWEAEEVDDFVMLLVALRPGLGRPSTENAGYWGQIAEWQDDGDEPDAHGPLDEFRHAARQDPATTLARIARTRTLVARLLAEPHGLVDDGAGGYDCPRWGTSAACQCGRDDRVRAYLMLLLPETTEET